MKRLVDWILGKLFPVKELRNTNGHMRRVLEGK